METPTKPAPLHVVLGAGQIGPLLAARLLARGHRVRMVRRGAGGALEAPGHPAGGVEWLRGDLTDPAFADRALAGAAVVYHCANPAHYHRWAEELPPLARAVREAAARAGAHLIVLDNLYMYGHAGADGWVRESAPLAPVSAKGRLRAQLHDELMAMSAAGQLRVTVGRAADFVGPHAERAAIFGAHFFARLPRGKAALVFGDADQPHAYAYTPDVAEALALLGDRPELAGQVFNLPVLSNESTRALVARFAAALGVPARTLRLPAWLLHVAGLFDGQLGALPEMLYQWQRPFMVDDSRFRAVFGPATPATSIDAAVAATLSSAACTSPSSAASTSAATTSSR